MPLLMQLGSTRQEYEVLFDHDDRKAIRNAKASELYRVHLPPL